MHKYAVHLIVFFTALAAGHDLIAEAGDIRQAMTKAHNKVRAGVHIQDMVWSDHLAAAAQEWADHLAQNNGCKLKHRPNVGRFAHNYGENLYWAGPLQRSADQNEMQKILPGMVVESWAGEAADYEYESNSCRPGRICGHYTQIVWKQTVRVGCGRAVCADKSQVWVCNYDPPGNYRGERPF